MNHRRDNRRGVALLATLLSIALMTFLVVDFTYSATIDYRGAANLMNELRADYLARSAIEVGLGILSADARAKAASQTPCDTLMDAWAAPFPPIPVEGGVVGISIVDDSRKLNINQLVNPTNGAVNPAFGQILGRLFALANLRPELLPAIIDWLDPDSVPSQGGAESSYYLGLVPPYEPRNGPMPTIGDLRMIRGVDDRTFALLSRMLTTAPDTRININTAQPEVIAALLPEFSNNPDLVKAIVAMRLATPIKTITDLNSVPAFAPFATQLSSLITTQSDFFTLAGSGTFAGARKYITATVRRNPAGPQLLASWHED